MSTRQRLPPGSDPLALNYTYIYDKSAGHGADVYILDTGIQTDHPDFGGRARWGATFGGYPDCDGNGHGTHAAGTVASVHFGVSKATNVIAVKVLGDDGCGWWSDVISGVDWVAKTAASSGRPSVASMSLGSGGFEPGDAAVASLIAGGVSTAVAAGNAGSDASQFSPARVPSALTSAGMSSVSEGAQLSNYGAPVNVYAPSEDVWSTWIGSSSKVASGTSSATTHVAGFVAYLLGMDSSLSTKDIAKTIDCYSTKDALKLSRIALDAGTPNKLLYNNYQEPKDDYDNKDGHKQ